MAEDLADSKNIPRLVIAAVSSGCGKTTIVTGILAGLKKQGLRVQSYKVGPDYIDPGFHELASGRPAHNLDTWLTSEAAIASIVADTIGDAEVAIIEGVMGLYDGGKKGVSSTAALARLLKAPVVLVIDTKSMGDSAAAVALGFRQYDPEVNLIGVILNRVGSDTHRQMLCEAMKKIAMPVLGCIYRSDSLRLSERHLGLTPVTEADTAESLAAISQAVAEQVDLPAILKAAYSAPPLPVAACAGASIAADKIRIAVAHDKAFSFYYPESLKVLTRYGAEIIEFSPLHDEKLPEADGIIFGGGFPEMFVAQLTANHSMRESVVQAGRRGVPIYAECGGFMYLTQRIYDFTGNTYEMAGLIPAECRMNKKLQTVGYIEAKPLKQSILGCPGDIIRGHEFHFSSMEILPELEGTFPWAFSFTKNRTGQQYQAGYAKANILASYLHLHFLGSLQAAANFINSCREYHRQNLRGE